MVGLIIISLITSPMVASRVISKINFNRCGEPMPPKPSHLNPTPAVAEPAPRTSTPPTSAPIRTSTPPTSATSTPPTSATSHPPTSTPPTSATSTPPTSAGIRTYPI
ncbi:hypothetical protein QJS10_CPA05g00724 [Acorus calamus]|uniref:Uncharacterized protein n=1 Tax=Acorus calamus TaxID=4465 RepID=A0AAV9F034_ACOCL|nr:hypothetical protein QJS10_CPA05g00724 [Acorus calamus]